MPYHPIVHFEIPAADPDRLADFYRQLFGWEITKMDMGGTPYYPVMTTESDENGMPKSLGINGGMYLRTDPGQHVVNYVDVESLDDYLAKAKSLGAQVVVEKSPVPGMGWFAQINDPDGNLIGIWQQDSSAG